MTREQTEAKILDSLRRSKLPTGKYFLHEQTLLDAIRLAWAAGQNYGFKRGGEFAVEKFDAGIGRATA